MQNMLYVDYAVTYPEGKACADERRLCSDDDDDEVIATHLYDGLCSQRNNIQPTMSGGSGGHLDDLSKLSDAERGLVLEVLRRDEELRKQELTRIQVLKSDVEALQHRLATNDCDGVGQSRRCSLCSTLFGWLFRRGDICRRCQKTRVCGNCRQTTTTPERWVCLLCYKKQQLYLKSGSWFHRTFSGRRRLRRLTESESSTFTFRKDVDKTRSVGLDNGSLPTSKSFTSSAALPQTEKPQVPPTQHTLPISGGVPGHHQLAPDQTGSCAYPDENDRQLLMLVSRNLKRADQESLSTHVEPEASERESPADSVSRRRADAEVFRRGHPAAKRCLSDEFPESLRDYETKGIRSYRTMEDLSSSFIRDDGSDSSTNSARIGEEASDAEREPCHGSISNGDGISEQIGLRNETGDFTGRTQVMGQEVGRNKPSTDEFQSLAKRKSPVPERKPFVTVRRSYATNEFDSNNSPSWSGEASLEEFSPETTTQEANFETTDWSGGSDADGSLISVRSDEMTSTTLEADLELLAWKAEIEQLFQGPSITYDEDWEAEIDSMGVLRDMVVWSGSTERGDGAGRGNGAGRDSLLVNGRPSFPPFDNAFEYVVDDHAQPIVVEVGEDQKGMTTIVLPPQPRRYLRVFNDEDSLSIISERTEPTGSDLASVDFDLPASETGFHSDAFDSSSDEEGLGVTLTDVGIDRTIDRIVDLEERLCPPPCDLDAEMDRLVAANQELLSRTFEMSTPTRQQVDKLNQHPDSAFYSGQENNENDESNENDANTTSGCESLPNTNISRSPNSLPSGSSVHISASQKKRDVPLPLRYDDSDDDPTTSDPVSNNFRTSSNHKHSIVSPQAIQPLSCNSFCSLHNVDGTDNQILDSLENGSRSPEAVGDNARKRTRSETRCLNGELSSDEIESINVDKPDYVNVEKPYDMKTKELWNEKSQHGSSEVGCRSPDDCKNHMDGNENQNDTDDVSFNQRNGIHCSGKQ